MGCMMMHNENDKKKKDKTQHVLIQIDFALLYAPKCPNAYFYLSLVFFGNQFEVPPSYHSKCTRLMPSSQVTLWMSAKLQVTTYVFQ